MDPTPAAVCRLEAVETGPERFAELRRRGVGRDLAAKPPGAPTARGGSPQPGPTYRSAQCLLRVAWPSDLTGGR